MLALVYTVALSSCHKTNLSFSNNALINRKKLLYLCVNKKENEIRSQHIDTKLSANMQSAEGMFMPG